jgi:hypothetical protein
MCVEVLSFDGCSTSLRLSAIFRRISCPRFHTECSLLRQDVVCVSCSYLVLSLFRIRDQGGWKTFSSTELRKQHGDQLVNPHEVTCCGIRQIFVLDPLKAKNKIIYI